MGIVDHDLLLKALDNDGLDSVPDLLTLTDGQIDALSYDDVTGGRVVSPSSRNKLRILRSWNYHLQQVQGVRRVDWMDTATVNEDEWDQYRIAIYVPAGMPPIPTQPVGSTASTPSSSRPIQASSQASDFRRGIKRDKSHYREIRDEKQWDEFKRTTVATVYAHGCENVIDPSYIPSTPDDVVLFEEQKKFMYDVWATILKTPMGKHYVRLHENTRDAHAVWRDYINYMRSSTRADIEIEDLMTSLTSLRITPSTRGSTQQFVLDWLDKLRIYEDLTPTSPHFPDIMKKAKLQNALNGLKIFRDVKTSEQLEVAKGQGPISYQAYALLIQQVAASYDKTLEPTNRRPPAGTRQVNATERDDHNWFDDSNYETADCEDTDNCFGSMSINATQQQKKTQNSFKKRPSLPKAA